MSATPLALSALVASCDEADKLSACLAALVPHCRDVTVVDMECSDDTAGVAASFGARVVRRQRVPVVEALWPSVVDLPEHPWILRVDPDEVIPPALFGDIGRVLAENPEAAMLRLPHRFYFRGKPLHTTRWGRIKSSPKVFHRDRVVLTGLVHAGIEPMPGRAVVLVPATADNPIRHYWAGSWEELIRKHRRYAVSEGPSRAGRGERFSWMGMARAAWSALRQSLIELEGYRGGPDGWGLSFFHAWYEAAGALSLRRHERANATTGSSQGQ